MRELKLNEYGRDLYVTAGTDISTATSYSVEFVKPDNSVTTVAASLGIVDATLDDKEGVEVTVLANEYVILTIPAGLIDQTGRWGYKLLAPTATTSIPGACGSFIVTD